MENEKHGGALLYLAYEFSCMISHYQLLCAMSCQYTP